MLVNELFIPKIEAIFTRSKDMLLASRIKFLPIRDNL